MSGFQCPKCGKRTAVIDSRVTSELSVRRRRQCKNRRCKIRFTTLEEIAHIGQRSGPKPIKSITLTAKQQVMASIERALKRMKP